MRRLFVMTAFFLFIAGAFASERSDRAHAEWMKFEGRGTNVCFGTGGLYLSYTPLDRRQWYAVQFSPSLQPDLLKRAAPTVHFKDESARQLVENEVNAALNQHIDELRNGTYNKIDVSLGKGNAFSITPANSETEPVLIWTFSGAGSRLVSVLSGMKPTDTVYVLQSDGKSGPIEKTNRPTWLESEDFFTSTGTGSIRQEHRRAAHFTECK
ncbi:MAG TPA: hypothetical protein VLV78_16525 [Thermoanaerobaculia bacterium]|nr:hypothetical protein [Thermoanaerobaculia bacterium]